MYDPESVYVYGTRDVIWLCCMYYQRPQPVGEPRLEPWPANMDPDGNIKAEDPIDIDTPAGQQGNIQGGQDDNTEDNDNASEGENEDNDDRPQETLAPSPVRTCSGQ
eukprot:11030489-Ditylum_brightwellii.AAC.1